MVGAVARQAREAGIKMAEVGIYDSPEMNAFATGARRDDSLVAVSSGLLYSMSRDEAEAVLAHEVSHVANGDMVTLTLIQGVVNTFVMFFARIVAGVISNFFSSNNDEESSSSGGFAYMITVFVLEMLFGVLASMIVMWFSRQREFRADAGAAQLMGNRQPMMNALARLGGMHPGELPKSVAAMGIAGGIGKLFSTHPPIEERIAALQNAR